MTQIKNNVKNFSGSPVFIDIVWECIEKDHWEKYSISSNKAAQSAFRSTNTVPLNTDPEVNKQKIQTQKCADLSFTPFGMKGVLERSQALKEKHSVARSNQFC